MEGFSLTDSLVRKLSIEGEDAIRLDTVEVLADRHELDIGPATSVDVRGVSGTLDLVQRGYADNRVMLAAHPEAFTRRIRVGVGDDVRGLIQETGARSSCTLARASTSRFITEE